MINGQNNKAKVNNKEAFGSTKKSASTSRPFFPNIGISWWTLVASAVGIASWLILPVITMKFRDIYPITDTWVMPAIGTFLIDVAAILNVIVIWWCKERSILNIIAAILVIPMALFSPFLWLVKASVLYSSIYGYVRLQTEYITNPVNI
jgi:hypothetical protein